jgi:hypothetical protein
MFAGNCHIPLVSALFKVEVCDDDLFIRTGTS